MDDRNTFLRSLRPILVKNLFTWLGSSFGKEDFFTASVAFFIERNQAFRSAFLAWLQTAAKEPLDCHSFEVRIQVGYPSRFGVSILDMCLINPEIELWFEHKLGSGLGQYQGVDGEQANQLEKYLDAASRVMNGRIDGQADADWPVGGPLDNQPRVLLFYISRDGIPLVKETYGSQIHTAGTHGLVWPDSGQLRWRDFWPSAQEALSGALKGEDGEFELTLSQQFLDYWKSIPRMWIQEVFDNEWLSLLPADIPSGAIVPFDIYLDQVEQLAVGRLDWRRRVNYQGHALEFSVPTGSVDHVTFSAMRRVDDIDLPVTELGQELIRLIFRSREEASGWERPPESLDVGKWKGVAKLTRLNNRDALYVYVGVENWGSCETQEQRTAAIIGAFSAGVKMFEATTAATLSGADKL